MTILKPIHFTDVDSKDAVSGKDSRWYYPFEGSTNGIDTAKGETLTGVTSGSKVKLLIDLVDGNTEMFGKLLSGTPEVTGETWKNDVGQDVFIGSGGYKEGQNVYLAMGDEYYQKLLRDNGIASDNADLIDPIESINIKKVLICYVEFEIFKDLTRDSRAPFDGQEILTDKYTIKRDDAQKCLNEWLTQLDENAFTGGDKGTDTAIVSNFGRY